MLSKCVFEDILLIAQLIAVFFEKVNFCKEQVIHIFIKNMIKIALKFAVRN